MVSLIQFSIFLVLTFANGGICADLGDIQSPVDYSKANINESVVTFTHYKYLGLAPTVYPVGTKNLNFGKRSIKIIVHGYNESGKKDWLLKIKDSFLPLFEVIVVDWSAVATNYELGASNTKKLGEYIARFIMDNKINLCKLQIVGCCLGGQASGQAGKYIYKNYRKKIGRITVLDLAGHKFEGSSTPVEHKFQQTDARRTECVHTNAREYGYKAPVANLDFYPNGGNVQPGCNSPNGSVPEDPCSHARAYWFYLESITYKATSVKADVSIKSDLVVLTNITPSNTVVFGQWCGKRANGTYTIKTNGAPRYLI